MTVPTARVLDRREASLLSLLRSRLFDRRAPELLLETEDQSIRELTPSDVLSFAIPRRGERVPAPAVEMNQEITAGSGLAADDPTRLAPVAGKVVGLRSGPDLRGAKAGLTVLLEPTEAPAPFLSLEPLEAPVEALRERLGAVGASTDGPVPRPLLDELTPGGGTLLVLAAEREPLLGGAGQLLRERAQDATLAAKMLGRIGAFERVLLGVLEPMAGSVTPEEVEVLPIPAVYPESLPTMLRAGDGLESATIVGIEAALAALDAVRSGRPQSHKVVTVVGPGGRRHGNFRVPLGTRIGDLLTSLKMKAKSGDKVVAGGPLAGYSQFSLDTSIDHGTTGIVLLRGKEVRRYSDEPCINCGSCIDSCPAHLQVHLLARYSEFGLFDRTPELSLDACFECGLCATVCPARRPLLQLIRLAKRELGTGEEGK